MRPSFKENFAKKSTCGFREQCTGPTVQKHTAEKRAKRASQTDT